MKRNVNRMEMSVMKGR